MTNWNAEKIKVLRRRMGWSQSDLARKLNCELTQVQKLEVLDGNEAEFGTELHMHITTLQLLEKQAESACDVLVRAALAEVIMDETHEAQIDSSTVRNRFSDKI